MSTRCQIGVYRNNEDKLEDFHVLLYRHCDGYPNDVLSDILPFLKKFAHHNEYFSTESLSAWLMWYLIQGYVETYAPFDYLRNSLYTPESGGFLGYGICDGFHADIEYYYKISPGMIEVYKTEYDQPTSEWCKINTVSI